MQVNFRKYMQTRTGRSMPVLQGPKLPWYQALGLALAWLAAIVAIAVAPLEAPAALSGGGPDYYSDGTMTLPGIARKTMALHFGPAKKGESIAKFAAKLQVQDRFKKPAGVFVTLSRDGRS